MGQRLCTNLAQVFYMDTVEESPRSILKLAIWKCSRENNCAEVRFSKAAVSKRTPSQLLFCEFSEIYHQLTYR